MKSIKFAMLALAISISPEGSSAIAQANNTQGASSSVACLARTTGSSGSRNLIVVPPGSQGQLEARGFVVASCSELNETMQTYRIKICVLANEAPRPIQQQFAEDIGATPRELCDLANAAIGS